MPVWKQGPGVGTLRRGATRAVVTLGVLLAAGSVQGRSPARQQWSLGAAVGIADPRTPEMPSAFLATVGLRYYLVPWLAVEPEVSYWERSTRPDLLVEDAFSDFYVGVSGVVVFPPRAPVHLYVGTGVGVHVLSREFRIFEFPAAEESEARMGFHVLSGLEVSLRPSVDVFFMGRYDFVSGLRHSRWAAGVRVHP